MLSFISKIGSLYIVISVYLVISLAFSLLAEKIEFAALDNETIENEEADIPIQEMNDWPHWRYMDSERSMKYMLYHAMLSPELVRIYGEKSIIDPSETPPTPQAVENTEIEMYAMKMGLHTNPKLKILIVCGQHGKEVITTTVCYEIMRRFLYNTWWRRLLREGDLSIVMIPLANPLGRDIAIEISPCHRTNHRYVDLNRNFPPLRGMSHPQAKSHPQEDDSYAVYRWFEDPDEQKYMGEVYPGTRPLSEFESVFIDRIISQQENENTPIDPSLLRFGCPDVVLNLHSGGRYVLRPYDSKYAYPKNHEVMDILSEILLIKHCDDCIQASGMVGLYQAIGTLGDFIQEKCEPIINFTWEVYVDEDAVETRDCFGIYNPRSKEGYDEVRKTWGDATETVVEHAMAIKKYGTEEYIRLMEPEIDE